MTSIIRYLKQQDMYQMRLKEYNRKQNLVQQRHEQVMKGPQRIRISTSACVIGDSSRRRNYNEIAKTSNYQPPNELKQVQNRSSTPFKGRDENKGGNLVVEESRERNLQSLRAARKIGACLRLGHVGFQRGRVFYLL
jgi:hypothetical protein